MSFTQWFTRSTPIVSCTPAMNATLSFVPTPSALATRTGLRRPVQRKQAAERSDPGQHAGRVSLARQSLDSAHGFIARVDVDARLAIVHSAH